MDKRLFFSATNRNRDAIFEVLLKFLPQSGAVLEIASGSGEHGVAFQERLPNLLWQASDPDPLHRQSICAWINYHGLSTKMPHPLDIDVERRPWPLTREFRSSLKAIVCINMIHISPWSCTKSLFEEARDLLKMNSLLIIYGPFKKNGNHTSQSNEYFDHSLRAQNPSWGVRDLEAVSDIGIKNGFQMSEIIQMPANNLSIVFHKRYYLK